jgi:hypothetical protein
VLRWKIALAGILSPLFLALPFAAAQVQPPSDKLLIDGDLAYTWNDGSCNVLQLTGPITIKSDHMELSAKQAVIWLSQTPGLVIPQQRAEIVLIGDAVAREPARGITRSGDELFVDIPVRGDIRVSAGQRLMGDQTATPIFQQALALRTAVNSEALASRLPLRPAGEGTTGTTYLPATTRPASYFRFHFNQVQSLPTPDGTQAFVLSGDVTIIDDRSDGDLMQIQADRAVVFTGEKTNGILMDSSSAAAGPGQKVTAAYIEGDVRIQYTPAKNTRPEQRLWANRVYYDFVTNEAVLTDAVLRSTDPATEIPITVRAEKLRQLSQGEYEGQKVELSTSSFATPTYSVKTDQVYIHQEQEPLLENPNGTPASAGAMQTVSTFTATADTLDFFGMPVFYWPQTTGTVDQNPFPLRTISFSGSGRFGTGFSSEWGLFDSLGLTRPPGLDVTFLADFYSKRGPATGFNGTYSGSNIDEDTKNLTDFSGLFKSFLITDHGTDTFGEDRTNVNPPDQLRGKFLWEHQQFFPDDWQAQFRVGYVSDPTFLEEYYPDDFYDNQPYDAEAYIKRQQDTEAITFLANGDTNHFVTTSDQQQEQFDVEHAPELGYRRIGDSFDDDQLTFFSENTLDRLRFDQSRYSLAQQGFTGLAASPGLPSEGYTGLTASPVDRGDTRQEVDYPIQVGQIKVVPYGIGRLTAYSDTPEGDSKDRVYGAMGVRMTTDFWKVDDDAESDLFDINRIRHIIEPEVNLYTSGENVNRDQLYVFDEDTDGISDFSAAQFALHQRWETYRGAPGRQQSVAFLTWNVEADIFTNPPKDAGMLPNNFRGLYFPSDPEASIPRDAINSDATWLMSDSTALLADEEYDVDHGDLATGAIGLAAKDYDRVAYYIGLRYIDPVNSSLATFAIQYQLTAKYQIEFLQSFDFDTNQNTQSEVTLRRTFDVLVGEFSVFHNSTTGDNGVRFNLYPPGMGPSTSNPTLYSYFDRQ